MLSLRASNEGLRGRALREHKSMTVALVSSSNPSYFPNAFFSSGSISPLAAIGSRTSVSP